MNLGSLLSFHEEKRTAATLAVYRVPDPTRCGIVSLNSESLVTSFVEKPSTPTSNLAFTGVLLASPEFLDALPNIQPADIGFDVLPRLVGKMSACEVTGYLQDIGTLHNYEEAQLRWPGLLWRGPRSGEPEPTCETNV